MSAKSDSIKTAKQDFPTHLPQRTLIFEEHFENIAYGQQWLGVSLGVQWRNSSIATGTKQTNKKSKIEHTEKGTRNSFTVHGTFFLCSPHSKMPGEMFLICDFSQIK